MAVIETERLILRELTPADAAFVHALLTDAAFLEHIGDRGVRTPEDAARVIPERYIAGYARDGFGMWAVDERDGGATVGLAGLVDRDGLDHIDLGYALLPAARGRGYAVEAARAVADWAAHRGIAPLLAIVSRGNPRSVAVLERIGFAAAGTITLPRDDVPVLLYRKD